MIRGIIDRRILTNYRLDPDVLANFNKKCGIFLPTESEKNYTEEGNGIRVAQI